MLDSQDVPCKRTERSSFVETLTTRLTTPAVGVPLDDLGVSLVDTEVTVDPTPAQVKTARTGVTPASFAIADYGSVVNPVSSSGAELVSLFVDRHVAVIDEHDVLPGMEAAFDHFGASFRDQAGSGIIATGPSATADMGNLVRGAHGPSEVHVIVLEDDHE
ncbi:LUD domain-containing protein [Haloarcula marina]|uniref:LUD domain-containing protein n=1 Tax=Haloarcula marina TaxID=2961574 RepID=UPI0020B7A2BC|nr:LUD domain-containing protein [Halomicroarcula marina]